jgi:hypothetical protein
MKVRKSGAAVYGKENASVESCDIGDRGFVEEGRSVAE